MPGEDQFLDRTPDLVARVRALRQAAVKEMNRFTRVSDYEVRRVVARGSRAASVSDETVAPSTIQKRSKKSAKRSAADQTSMEFPPAPVEPGHDGENA